MAAGWLASNFGHNSQQQFGLRYVPEFSLKKKLTATITLDAEVSLNIWGSGRAESFRRPATDGDMKPYRMWIRLVTPRFEIRGGLQKINFGSASILRPLMWFDRLDPRDPLQITDGVYGLLMRYYFANNTNVWLWALYGNDKVKGWEAAPTLKKSPEYGGRFQVPLFKGEIALTYHHRKARFSLPTAGSASADIVSPEDRYAIDGKWDAGVGIWFEGTLIHQRSALLPVSWTRSFTLGLDYTFRLGNGLSVLGEYFSLEASRESFAQGEGARFSACSVRYPFGILDSLTALVYYDWKTKNVYRFVDFQRMYDKWSFHLIGFWNPKVFGIYRIQKGNSAFSGTGIQVMVVYNY